MEEFEKENENNKLTKVGGKYLTAEDNKKDAEKKLVALAETLPPKLPLLMINHAIKQPSITHVEHAQIHIIATHKYQTVGRIDQRQR